MSKKIKKLREILTQKKNEMEELMRNPQCYMSPYMEEILILQADIDELEDKINGSKKKAF